MEKALTTLLRCVSELFFFEICHYEDVKIIIVEAFRYKQHKCKRALSRKNNTKI